MVFLRKALTEARQVYPAAGFASRVKAHGGKVAVFNTERSDGELAGLQRYANVLTLSPNPMQATRKRTSCSWDRAKRRYQPHSAHHRYELSGRVSDIAHCRTVLEQDSIHSTSQRERAILRVRFAGPANDLELCVSV